jgi:hypothetical protein
VWLEDGPTDVNTFPQALEWAFRLSLPLRAVIRSPRLPGAGLEGIPSQGDVPVVEKMKAWGLTSSQRGVALEMFMWLGDGPTGMNQFLRPNGLCVVGEDPRAPALKELLCRSSRGHENAALLCAANSLALARILILYDQTKPNAAFLESAARFAHVLEVPPVILIVAKTEREAHQRRSYAEGVCSSLRVAADFDFVVGCDPRSAVRRVAQWRSCSHLIVEREIAASWWGCASRRGQDHLRELTDSLTVLALPESIVLDVPRKICNDRPCLLGPTRHTPKPETLTEVSRD